MNRFPLVGQASRERRQGSVIYSVPGQVICFEKRRKYFLAVQSCCARKSCPNFPVWALARLRKFTGLSVRARPCRPHAGVPAGEAFEADYLPLHSIRYVFNDVVLGKADVNGHHQFSPATFSGLRYVPQWADGS